jgi:Legionella pneumophila major outer membrane protein precursor
MNKTLTALLSLMVVRLLTVPAQAQSFPAPPSPLASPSPLSSPAPLPSTALQPPPDPIPPAPPFATYQAPPPSPPPPPVYSGLTMTANPPMALHDPWLYAADQSFWSFGVGVYIMEPIFQSNPAYINGHINNGAAVYKQTDFSQNATGAPLAWLGYTWSGGWGIRGRWFEFSSSGNTSDTVGPLGIYAPGGISLPSTNPGDAVSASSVLYGDVVDLEATYTMGGDNWSLIGSAGVRYVHLNQSYSLGVFDPTNGITKVYSVNNFNGAGPTLAIEGRRQIGASPFALYGSARGSIVFGEAHQWANIADPVNGTMVFGGRQTSVLCIGEMELGAEWRLALGRGRSSFYTQLGCVGQFWTGAGNPSQALSVNTSNIAPGSNFGFIGGVIRAGIDF